MPAYSQDADPAARAPVLVVPRTDRPPALDAGLDDPAWASAALLRDWVQTLPGDNSEPDGETEVRFLHDDDALYLLPVARGGVVKAGYVWRF